jgi:hypothetical protein
VLGSPRILSFCLHAGERRGRKKGGGPRATVSVDARGNVDHRCAPQANPFLNRFTARLSTCPRRPAPAAPLRHPRRNRMGFAVDGQGCSTEHARRRIYVQPLLFYEPDCDRPGPRGAQQGVCSEPLVSPRLLLSSRRACLGASEPPAAAPGFVRTRALRILLSFRFPDTLLLEANLHSLIRQEIEAASLAPTPPPCSQTLSQHRCARPARSYGRCALRSLRFRLGGLDLCMPFRASPFEVEIVTCHDRQLQAGL